MNWLSHFPDEKTLLTMYSGIQPLNVNAHIHTPFSFSAFTGIQQIFAIAKSENLAALGINDFFVTDGYDDFYNEALRNRVFPLFNIEFISLLKNEQQSGIRINDPNNPGRCYFCGKGLNYPFNVDPAILNRLNGVIALSQDQIRAMIQKVNELTGALNIPVQLDYERIRNDFARKLVRERHIAQAIRMAIQELSATDSGKTELYTRLFSGKQPESSMADHPALENEIRAVLLKSGGAAFVEEDEATFLNIAEIIHIIRAAGGIPCYPVLLDDKKGSFTEFEQSPEALFKNLEALNVRCIEFIPGRNDVTFLEKYMEFFSHKGFVILLGTEHNTPDMIPLTPETRGNKPLTPHLQKISYEGTCVVAAHQYRRAKGTDGFSGTGEQGKAEREYFIQLGNAVILHHKQAKN